MSYNEIFDSLSQVFNGFFNEILIPFFQFIRDTPLLSVGIMVSTLPVVAVVIGFFYNISRSSDVSFVGYESSFASGFKSIYSRVTGKKILSKVEKEKERQRSEAQHLADEFFKNNPNRMSINVNGFRFMAPDWEKKNWSNSKRTTVTKTYRTDARGNLYVANQSIRSTESYNNTSDLQLTNNYDVD